MSGQQQAPAALYSQERPSIHFTGGWVGPRAGLDKQVYISPRQWYRKLERRYKYWHICRVQDSRTAYLVLQYKPAGQRQWLAVPWPTLLAAVRSQRRFSFVTRWSTKRHWDRSRSECFGFPLSLPPHHCSIFIHVSDQLRETLNKTGKKVNWVVLSSGRFMITPYVGTVQHFRFQRV